MKNSSLVLVLRFVDLGSSSVSLEVEAGRLSAFRDRRWRLPTSLEKHDFGSTPDAGSNRDDN